MVEMSEQYPLSLYQGFTLEYFKIITSILKISSIYTEIYYDTFTKALKSTKDIYNEWITLMDNRFDKELRSDRFTHALTDYINSYVNLHGIISKINPYMVRYSDIILEQIMYIAFNSYTSNLALALSVYRELDSTPYDVVWQQGKTRLLHYKGNASSKPPILIVYAMINRYHIMDISKEKSVVRRLIENGLDVYLLDWGHASYTEDGLSLKYYIECIDESIKKILEISKYDKVSLLGYCWGGIVALIYASLHKERLSSLIVMAAPVDTSKDDGILARWAKSIDAKRLVAEYGHMNGQMLDIAFFMRNPIRYGILKYISLWKRFNDRSFIDTFVAVERWLYNTPYVPGKLYEQIIEECYKKNILVYDKAELDGISFSLRSIDVPLLTIVAENDDLTSPESTIAVNYHVSSKDKSILKIPGGHVGLCISTAAHKNLWPEVARWVISKSKYNKIEHEQP
jgi:polyhydroxyalkanoate synthase